MNSQRHPKVTDRAFRGATRRRPWLSIPQLLIAVACSDPKDSVQAEATYRDLVGDPAVPAEDAVDESETLASILDRVDLPDGRIPVLEASDGPSGRYALYIAGYANSEGSAAVREHGFKQLAVLAANVQDLADVEAAVPTAPKVDLRIAEKFAQGLAYVPVAIWPTESPEKYPPIYLEMQKAQLRGTLTNRKEEEEYRKTLLEGRRAQVENDQSAILTVLASLGVKPKYRCIYASCILATVPADAVAQLGAAPSVELVELQDGRLEPQAPTGGIVGATSQTLQFWSDFYDGSGTAGNEVIVSMIEAPPLGTTRGFPNEEHFGFFDCAGGTCPRILSRTACIGDDDVFGDDYTCVFPTVIPESDEGDHATGVLGIILGDPHDSTGPDWDARRGYATEAEVHVLADLPDSPFGLIATLDQTLAKTPATDVVNMSLGNTADDPTCLGRSTTNRRVNDLYEAGMLPVVAAGDGGHGSTTNCTVLSPGSALSAFTVGSYGDDTNNTVNSLNFAADVSDFSPRGGTSSEGFGRTIMDIVAPGYRSNMFSTSATSGAAAYNYSSAGTSFAAPIVTSLAVDLIDWAQHAHSGFLNNNPGVLHAMLLTMGDGQTINGGVLLSGTSNLWGVGRLHARKWNAAGLDNPWAYGMGSTCVGHHETVIVPMLGAPDPTLDIDVVKTAIYWYDPRQELNGTLDDINLTLNRVGGLPIRSSASAGNEYERVTARQAAGDNIRSLPLEMLLYGQNVTADNIGGCGQNRMLVSYAYFIEDTDRDDADGPSSVIRPE